MEGTLECESVLQASSLSRHLFQQGFHESDIISLHIFKLLDGSYLSLLGTLALLCIEYGLKQVTTEDELILEQEVLCSYITSYLFCYLFIELLEELHSLVILAELQSYISWISHAEQGQFFESGSIPELLIHAGQGSIRKDVDISERLPHLLVIGAQHYVVRVISQLLAIINP